jgi:hypothetical protein
VIISDTPSDTSLLLETTLASQSLHNNFEIIITSNISDYEPCLIQSMCENCSLEDGSCTVHRNAFVSGPYRVSQTTQFGSSLEYRCSLGKEFRLIRGGGIVPSHNVTCDWNEMWTPTIHFDCIGKYHIYIVEYVETDQTNK